MRINNASSTSTYRRNTQRLEIFKGKFKDTNVEPCKISQWWPDQWMEDQQYHK
jgi:hypothetical protein